MESVVVLLLSALFVGQWSGDLLLHHYYLLCVVLFVFFVPMLCRCVGLRSWLFSHPLCHATVFRCSV